MKNGLDKLSEEDFAVLKGPIQSGRQRPASLAGNLMLSAVLILFMLTVINWIIITIMMDEPYPVIIAICIIFDVIGVVLCILSIVYSFKQVYRTRQSAQYFIVIWVSQYIFGGMLYAMALFIVFHDIQYYYDGSATNEDVAFLAIATLVVGIVVFIIAFIRFRILLVKGQFRDNTKRDKLRGKLEAKSNDFMMMAITVGTSVSLIGTSIVKIFQFDDFQSIVIQVIGFGLFYVMLFILPEQLVIWYCIKRFRSFRFRT